MRRDVRTKSAIKHLLSLGYTVTRPAETHTPSAVPPTPAEPVSPPAGVVRPIASEGVTVKRIQSGV